MHLSRNHDGDVLVITNKTTRLLKLLPGYEQYFPCGSGVFVSGTADNASFMRGWREGRLDLIKNLPTSNCCTHLLPEEDEAMMLERLATKEIGE